MSKKEYPSVCILDCYFEQMNKNGSYYRISDKELAILVARVNTLEYEKNIVINRSNYHYRRMDKEIKKWRTLAHVYKIELGRCVRKLTRIYEEVYAIGALLHFVYHNECSPQNLVDSFKSL